MKTLTIRQPWATLIMVGVKHYETRSWQTDYRGKLAIHAGLKFGPDERAIYLGQEVSRALQDHDDPLRFGAVLGIVDLVDILPVKAVPAGERMFGDFSPGRFAWVLENPVWLERPVPVPGKLGLWEWT